MAELVAHPGGEYDGEACAVDVHVRDGPRPHERRPGFIIRRIRLDARSRGDDRLERAFAESVGEIHARFVCKIAFEDMRHHIRDAACRLVLRKRVGELRIEYRKRGAQTFPGRGTLEKRAFLGDDRVAGSFGTGRGNGEDDAYRKRFPRHAPAFMEIPEVSVIDRSHGDGLRRVDHGAAAHRENEIDALFSAEVYAFVYRPASGIRTDTAEVDEADACGFERSAHAGQKPASFRGTAAEDKQRLARACIAYKFADLGFGALPEYETGGRVIGKVNHKI